MKPNFLICSAIISGAFCTSLLAAENWSQWRGPLQTGAAPDANPPTAWNESRNLKWKVKIPGDGTATPIIWEKMVFVQTAIPAGKKPARSVAARTDATAPPDRQSPPDDRSPGPTPGPAGGLRGLGPGGLLSQRMISQGDKNHDEKLSREELTTLAEEWFTKLDSDKTGKLNQDTFVERFPSLLGPPPEGGNGGAPPPGGPGGPRGGGPGRFFAPGFFGATDANKDGTLTREEFTATFGKWFDQWDTAKSGSLEMEKLREGLNGVLPRPQFGGGRGGGGRGGGGPGGGRPGGPGPGGRGAPGGMSGENPTESYQFVLLCLDRDTGKVLWQKTAREEVPHEGVRDGDGSFAATSGLTDGKKIYAFFGSRGLYCYEFSGSLIWTQDFGKMRIKNNFGEGSSPALHGNTLVVIWDNENGSFLTALDKNTGKQLWKETRDEGTTWSTPLIVEAGGKTQVITSGTRKIRSYDIATGKIIWECKGLTANVIPYPVADADKVYCTSGFGGSALYAIRLDRTGDLTGTDAIVWTHNQGTPYVPSPLLYNGKLYFYRSNNPRLTCLDTAAGKALIDMEPVEGLGNMVYASPLGAAGRIYLTDRSGTTVVLKQSEKLEILATNKLDDHIDASPVAVGNELFLRGRQYLYCLAETSK
jgi:outer membrane protein assembly factor BamB